MSGIAATKAQTSRIDSQHLEKSNDEIIEGTSLQWTRVQKAHRS